MLSTKTVVALEFVDFYNDRMFVHFNSYCIPPIWVGMSFWRHNIEQDDLDLCCFGAYIIIGEGGVRK